MQCWPGAGGFPFLAGILILIIGSWLRKGLVESPDFLKERKKDSPAQSPLKKILIEMPGRIFQMTVVILDALVKSQN